MDVNDSPTKKLFQTPAATRWLNKSASPPLV